MRRRRSGLLTDHLEKVCERFAGDESVRVVEHDLGKPLPDLGGTFDTVVSCFAIHHLKDQRKRELYEEVFGLLEPGGVLCNLEHVSSPTARLHERFLGALGLAPNEEDPSNRLLDVETQLRWLRKSASWMSIATGSGWSSRSSEG